MLLNRQFPANLFTFTEEILKEKLRFLYSGGLDLEFKFYFNFFIFIS